LLHLSFINPYLLIAQNVLVLLLDVIHAST
jgi:hypothetical protein